MLAGQSANSACRILRKRDRDPINRNAELAPLHLVRRQKRTRLEPDEKINTAVLIAGGLGIAPLLILSQFLVEKGIPIHLFWGTKTSAELCCFNDFKDLKVKIFTATEDGSSGYKGFVTDALNSEIGKFSRNPKTAFFACGPNPMLYHISKIAQNEKISCQVSLETLMACGLGACLGCGVETKQANEKYIYVCKSGPVFNANEIELSD